ncbi:MAG: NAD(P)H-hydrate dehydratase [bacterium]|nr:NAD(P)H-hydrate dehydratase [bacterium]
MGPSRVVATTAETRAAEAAWFEAGLPPELLMERVAVTAARWLRGLRVRKVRIVAGRGHNGADALAIARLVAVSGIDTEIAALEPAPASLAARQLRWALTAGARRVASPAAWVPEPGAALVDGLLGTGFHGELRPETVAWIEALQAAASGPVLSLDAPSGLDLDTGVPSPTTVRATHTLATGVYKRGHVSDLALPYLGRVGRIDLGLERLAPGILQPRLIRPASPLARPSWLHKGTAGTVLVVGGSPAMAGAPALAGLAALRAGAGLVAIAVPRAIRDCVAGMVPEAIVLPLDSLQANPGSDLADWWSRADALVLGPGTVAGSGREASWQSLIARPGAPRVVDGGAIASIEAVEAATVWTPHPGEAARVLDTTTAEIQQDRFVALEKLKSRLGGTIVLKGTHTLIGTEGLATGVNVVGAPSLATAGSGDVLAGIVAAGLAAGQTCHEAAEQGVALHGLVGWLASDRGLLAREIANGIPAALARTRTAPPDEMGCDLETLLSWAIPWQEESRLL